MKELAKKVMEVAIAYNIVKPLSIEHTQIQISGLMYVFAQSGLDEKTIEQICINGLNGEYGTIFTFNPTTVNQWLKKGDVKSLVPNTPDAKFEYECANNPELLTVYWAALRDNGYVYDAVRCVWNNSKDRLLAENENSIIQGITKSISKEI
jgi:hypothetical protein